LTWLRGIPATRPRIHRSIPRGIEEYERINSMPTATSKRSVRASAVVVPFTLLLALLLGPSAAFAAATLSPSSWDFGNHAVGTSSAKTFTYGNTDPNTSVTVTGVSVTGAGFSEGTDNCSGPLAGGASCTVNVTFHPGSRGSFSGSLTVTDDVNGSSSSSLAGTGISPGAALSPTSLSFSGVPVGSTSSAKAVTLTNNGNATLSISSTSASGDFKRSSSCGSSLATRASCTISVTFSPTAQGSRTGTLTVSDNAGTQKVSLSGTGLAPSVKFSPSSLTFEKQRKGTTSLAQTVRLSNVGKAALTVSGVSASGDFSQTSTCVGSVAVGGSCTISVTFHPTAEGTRSGTLTVKANAGSANAALSGLGVFPAFSINQTKVKFSKTGLAEPSAPKKVKITNPGTDRLYIQKLTVTGDFSQTNTCEPYVNPGITCTISITFSPTKLDGRSGVLTVVHDLGRATVKLSGLGIPGAGPTTGPSRPEPTLRPSTATGPGEVPKGSHLMRFLLGGGLLVLLAGIVLMFFSRGRGEEPVPNLPVEDTEAVAGPNEREADDVPLLASLEGVEDTLMEPAKPD
jgi:archaellum component FlaF (FlaF/FlaG flagellin family)